MLYRERASTRHLFGRSTRVPPSSSRGRTSARHIEVAVMLLHFLHFCNSLFTSPRMRRPEHGAYGAAGLWRRATLGLPDPRAYPRGTRAASLIIAPNTHRPPSLAVYPPAPATGDEHPGRPHARRPTGAAFPGACRAPAWLRPRRCTATWAGRTRGVSR